MIEASNANSRTPTDATTTDSRADHSDITIRSTCTNQPRIYVWKFFKKTDKYNQCRFIMANGSECGKKLALDKKSSTTSMKNHLETKHQIRDDKLPNQGNILASFKKVKTGHVVSPQSILIIFGHDSPLVTNNDDSNLVEQTRSHQPQDQFGLFHSGQ